MAQGQRERSTSRRDDGAPADTARLGRRPRPVAAPGTAGPTATPVNDVAPARPHANRPRIAPIVVAVLVALLLAFPVIWGIAELVVLARLVGPWIWAWVAVVAGLLGGAIVIGYRIAQNGL